MGKRIVPGAVKDDKGIYIKQMPSKPETDIKVTDISLDDLIGKYYLILHRETKNLLIESAAGKLDKDSSQCMRDNIKLLLELKKKEKELLESLTDEELKDIVSE